MNNEIDIPSSELPWDDGGEDLHRGLTESAICRMMRMLNNHKNTHDARIIIMAVYRPDAPANWSQNLYLFGKLEKFQNDPIGWVLTLDNGNVRRLIKLSEGY